MKRLFGGPALQFVPRAAAGDRGAAGAAADGVSALCRSVIEFRNLTEAISRLSINAVVFDSRNMCDNSSVIATARPDAVLFIATEIDAASRLALSAGFAVATAPNASINPVIVPSRPINRPTFASDDR